MAAVLAVVWAVGPASAPALFTLPHVSLLPCAAPAASAALHCSGTYAPPAKGLPLLRDLLAANFPGMVRACAAGAAW